MVQSLPAAYVFDPSDPRAPTDAQWDAMTLRERRRVVAMLPAEPQVSFLPPAEGDRHRRATWEAHGTLDRFFRREGRKIYISSNLAVYYPGESTFSPDVIAVLDADPHERETWMVCDERKGIDLALEIRVNGSRIKDLRDNVRRFARLGIREYFVFDRARVLIRGFRLSDQKPGVYERLVPQEGRFSSEVLGLDLVIEGTSLRFYDTTGPLLDTDERLARIEAAFDAATARISEADARIAEADDRAAAAILRADAEKKARRRAQKRAADAAKAKLLLEKRAAAEARRAAELEEQVRSLQAELARWSGRGK